MDHQWCQLPYFVDKSLLIKTFLKSRHKVILITAPQGFLKTTNIRMIASFLSIGPHDDWETNRIQKSMLFHDLNIMKYKRIVDEHLGKYPVVYFSFYQWEAYSVRSMVTTIQYFYSKYQYLRQSARLTLEDIVVFETYLEYDHKDLGTSKLKLADALKTICELLHKHYEKKLYVFIDNYDAPVLEAMAKNRPMYNFQPFLQRMISGVCNSQSVHKVLLTGITSAERSLGNDVTEYKFLHNHAFSKYFGFTEEDLPKVANKCSAEVLQEMQSRNYITITGTKMYSPEWILNYLNYSQMEDRIWYHSLFTKPVYRTPSIQTKLRILYDGRTVKFTICKFDTPRAVLLLNKLLNGTLEDELEESEIDMLMTLLLEFGMLTFAENSNSTTGFSCWTSSQKMKFSIINTSRISKCLKISF